MKTSRPALFLSRAMLVVAASSWALTACGSDSGSGSDSTAAGATAEESTATSAAAGEITIATAPPSEATPAVDPEVDPAVDPAPTETAAANPDQNPAITALLDLDVTGVCAFAPKADVEAIVGITVDDPDGTSIAGLGTNCIYYADGFDIAAKVEFQSITWSAAAGIATAEFGNNVPAEPCTVGGKDAFCSPAHEAGGITIGDSVLVKLGGDYDFPMLVESDLGMDQALAVAELALANLAAAGI